MSTSAARRMRSFFRASGHDPCVTMPVVNLIKYAYAFEQATQYRRQPRYLPTAIFNVGALHPD